MSSNNEELGASHGTLLVPARRSRSPPRGAGSSGEAVARRSRTPIGRKIPLEERADKKRPTNSSSCSRSLSASRKIRSKLNPNEEASDKDVRGKAVDPRRRASKAVAPPVAIPLLTSKLDVITPAISEADSMREAANRIRAERRLRARGVDIPGKDVHDMQLVVSGCANPTISSIVKGTYRASSGNHGRTVFRKDPNRGNPDDLDVLVYFWDDRDGDENCGWWFGPAVGGDQVWAYHPSRAAMSPPATEWNVPHDSVIDPTFNIISRLDCTPTPRFASAKGKASPAETFGGARASASTPVRIETDAKAEKTPVGGCLLDDDEKSAASGGRLRVQDRSQMEDEERQRDSAKWERAQRLAALEARHAEARQAQFGAQRLAEASRREQDKLREEDERFNEEESVRREKKRSAEEEEEREDKMRQAEREARIKKRDEDEVRDGEERAARQKKREEDRKRRLEEEQKEDEERERRRKDRKRRDEEQRLEDERREERRREEKRRAEKRLGEGRKRREDERGQEHRKEDGKGDKRQEDDCRKDDSRDRHRDDDPPLPCDKENESAPLEASSDNDDGIRREGCGNKKPDTRPDDSNRKAENDSRTKSLNLKVALTTERQTVPDDEQREADFNNMGSADRIAEERRLKEGAHSKKRELDEEAKKIIAEEIRKHEGELKKRRAQEEAVEEARRKRDEEERTKSEEERKRRAEEEQAMRRKKEEKEEEERKSQEVLQKKREELRVKEEEIQRKLQEHQAQQRREAAAKAKEEEARRKVVQEAQLEEERKLKAEEDSRLQEETRLKILEQMKQLQEQAKALEEAEGQRQETMRIRAEEEQRVTGQKKASLIILFSLTTLASALPEDYEKLHANFEKTMQQELPRTGPHADLLLAEAEKTHLHAKKYVEQVRDQRSRFQAWQARPKNEASVEP